MFERIAVVNRGEPAVRLIRAVLCDPDAGWSADAIVTISQLIAFLTYQIRVVHGLATIKEAGLR